jgi:hypothetical protein
MELYANDSLTWYKLLPIHIKINFKECAILLVGISWEQLSLLFSFEEKIDILYNKLTIEKII